MSNKNIETRILNNIIDLTNTTNDFIIKKDQTNYLTINNTSGELFLENPINMTALNVVKDNIELFVVDNSGVYISKPLDLSGNGIIKISDLSGLKFNNGVSDVLYLDSSAIHINKPLDLSGNGIIKISDLSGLKINNSINDILILKSNNNQLELDVSNNLKIKGTSLFIESGSVDNIQIKMDPLLVYSVTNTTEYYEKKYILKTELPAYSTGLTKSKKIIFKDIRASEIQSITFTIKVVSRETLKTGAQYNSLHLLIFGNGANYEVNNNKLTWKLNINQNLDDNWNIPDDSDFTFVNNDDNKKLDLQITIKSNRIIATDWMITLESIAV